MRVPTSGPKDQMTQWLRAAVSARDNYEKVVGAQERCSGIELGLERLYESEEPDAHESVDAYMARMREGSHRPDYMSFLHELDWDSLESEVREKKLSLNEAAELIRDASLNLFIQHAESLDVFTPHLNRVPRDVDGKLLPNKDAGCSPPGYIVGSIPSDIRAVPAQSRNEAAQALSDTGIIVLQEAVGLDSIEKVREALRIQSTFAPDGKRFETRETRPDVIFEGDRAHDVSFTQLASGRYAYQLRCSQFESVVKPLHAGVMPVVWEYLSRQRSDSLLNRLLGHQTSKSPRVFLSEVSLVCSDPLSGNDSWHATNGGSGVVVLVPLSPYQPKVGSTVVLPGSHKAWRGPSGIISSMDTVLRKGGVAELTADCGDAVVLDARLMRMTLKNESFNRSRVWVAFHYDFTDKPAPYQWLPRTLFMNALAVSMVHMDNLYRKLPPLSRPNKLE